jgi:chorismate dehydratase
MLDLLESDQADIALCPIIDYHRAKAPLTIVPVGGIACRGPTLTVRLFSRQPFASLDHIHIDPDSHTSVALLSVLWADKFGKIPTLSALPTRALPDHPTDPDQPNAILLIGDKVVTHQPPPNLYPYQMDLGQAWHETTRLPFVFAAWMCKANTDLRDLPRLLAKQRTINATRIDQIADRSGPDHGWKPPLAREYLGRLLHYDIGERDMLAIERFSADAHRLGIIDRHRPIRLYPETNPSA